MSTPIFIVSGADVLAEWQTLTVPRIGESLQLEIGKPDSQTPARFRVTDVVHHYAKGLFSNSHSVHVHVVAI